MESAIAAACGAAAAAALGRREESLVPPREEGGVVVWDGASDRADWAVGPARGPWKLKIGRKEPKRGAHSYTRFLIPDNEYSYG